MKSTRFLLWSTLGPVLLNLGFVCILFKFATDMWHIVAVAFAGLILTWLWKKSGFLISLIVLSIVMVGHFRMSEPLWPALLSTSVALSWLVLLLGHQEAQTGFESLEAKITSLEQDNAHLSHQMQLAINARNAEEISRHNWKEKYDQMAQEVSAYQRKEKAFQHALEDAQSQLLKLKYAEPPIALQSNIVEQVEEMAETPQYAQLREQFDEKSEVLNQTRKQLFTIEGQLLALQQEVEERACLEVPEDLFIAQRLQDVERLECEVLDLEGIISQLHAPKKPGRAKKAKTKVEAQEELFNMAHGTVKIS